MNYFDYAATTPLHPEAANVYLKLAQQCYGNTSSLHEIGAEAQNMLTYCRQQIAEMLECKFNRHLFHLRRNGKQLTVHHLAGESESS